jgi:hypothetical protein
MNKGYFRNVVNEAYVTGSGGSAKTLTYDEFKKLEAFYNEHSNSDSIHAKFEDLLEEYFNVKDEYESVEAYIREQISNPDW